MNDNRNLAAVAGFAFVAAWIGFGLGYAVLCLVGAAVFYAAAGVLEGNIDLGELQGRLSPDRDPYPSTPARPPRRARVQ